MIRIKQMLYDRCQTYIASRIETSEQAIEAAQASANDETKSSAGDKYETGRAMMQLEIEKNTVQLNESMRLKKILDQIKPDSQSVNIRLGSLAVTDQGNFFLAISVGVIDIEGIKYAIVSPESPIGARLMGLQSGALTDFNKKTYKIEQVW